MSAALVRIWAIRVWAIAKVDLLGRLRRPATLVTFLLLCFVAYLWVPDPSSGQALMIVDNQRALYNSAAMALATGVLCSFLLGLVGYYLVSESLTRDARSRRGFVIAASPVSNLEYLLGKCLGNAVFLGALVLGYLVSSMAMQLVRGEAPLEIGPYLLTYGLLAPPAIFFVSGIAVLFQAIPWLGGKLGDVVYFFIWMFMLAATITSQEASRGVSFASYIDVSGLAFCVGKLKAQTGTDSIAIGANSFETSSGIYVFSGIELDPVWLAPRLVSTFLPAAVTLGLALLVFHRFDPERLRLKAGTRGKGYLQRLDTLVRPLVGRSLGWLLRGLGRRPSALGAIGADVALTLILSPMVAVALLACVVAGAVVPRAVLASGWLPATFAIVGVLVADVASRERRSGTAGMVAAMPGLPQHFTLWKLATTAVLAVAFTLVPALRLGAADPRAAFVVLAGAVSIAAAATALGLLAGTPKAFIVLFLLFLYVVLNDQGRIPALDFASFFTAPSPARAMAYLFGAAMLLGLAHGVESRVRAR